MVLYVRADARNTGDGSREHPFRLIGEAARVVAPGDTVLVAPGIYREQVSPRTGGTFSRVTFRSEITGAAIITGTEPLTHWEETDDGWRCALSDACLYGSVSALYADGIRLVRADSAEMFRACAQGRFPVELDENTAGVWFPDTEDGVVFLYVTLDGRDPGGCEMEAVFRPYSFYADTPRVNNVTVSGFILHGTAGCAGGSGWVFEDCEITYGETDALRFEAPGEQAYTVRRCHIHDVTGAGIAVYGGARNVLVESCHLHDLGTGIALEGASRVTITGNRADHCGQGIRLFHSAQNVLIAGNLLHDNGTDVPHGCDLLFDAFLGPVTLTANLFLSSVCADILAHGFLFANNLIAGIFKRARTTEKTALCHVRGNPHDALSVSVTAGDAHFYRNIFLSGGTVLFHDCPAAFASGEKYLPVYARGNIYCNHSAACDADKDSLFDMRPVSFSLRTTDAGETVLETNLWDALPALTSPVPAFSPEHRAYYSDLPYADEETARIVRADYEGRCDPSAVYAGPFLHAGEKTVVFDRHRTGEEALSEAADETLKETRAVALTCAFALLNCVCAQEIFVKGTVAWIRTEQEGTLKEADCAYGIAKTLDRWTMEADETLEASAEEAFLLLAEAVCVLYESLRGAGGNLTKKRRRLTEESEKLLAPYGISMRLTANYLKFVGESTRSFLTLEEVIRAIHRKSVDYVAEVLDP